jgi:signal transduction histidine kinase
LNRKQVDLPALVAGCVDIYEPVAEEKGIELNMSCAPHVAINADDTLIRQAVLNLVDNAVKYTSPGGRVEITVLEEDQQAAVTVRDTGTGIPAKDIDHIWDRLYRSDEHISTPGLGLGLSYVRAIVLAHDGSVDVKSRPGEGSTFSIFLPMT